MKNHAFLISQNGWEYSGHITITANEVRFEWSRDHKEWWSAEGCDGNVVIADGIRIEFDEPFEYNGTSND